MLRDVSELKPTTVIAHVPIIDTRHGATHLQTLLESYGVSRIFDKEEADLTNLDRGGQYVSYLKQDHQFAISSMGLMVDSAGVVATEVNKESPFFVAE